MSIYSQATGQTILTQNSGTITTNLGTTTTSTWVNITYNFKREINLSNIEVFKFFINNLDNEIKNDYSFNLLIPSSGSKWTIIMESKFKPKIKGFKLCDYLYEAFKEFIEEDYIGNLLLTIKFYHSDILLESIDYHINL